MHVKQILLLRNRNKTLYYLGDLVPSSTHKNNKLETVAEATNM